jgi:DNA methylase
MWPVRIGIRTEPDRAKTVRAHNRTASLTVPIRHPNNCHTNPSHQDAVRKEITEIIWAKSHGKSEPIKNRPTTRHETILMMTQSKKDYFYHGDSIRTPSKDTSVKSRSRFYDQEDRKGRVFGDALGANAGSVWYFPPQ